MKYMITAALALCLMGGAAAAQDHDQGRGPEGRQGGGPAREGGREGRPSAQPPVGQTHGFRGGPA